VEKNRSYSQVIKRDESRNERAIKINEFQIDLNNSSVGNKYKKSPLITYKKKKKMYFVLKPSDINARV
jgi:hypothetical protein